MKKFKIGLQLYTVRKEMDKDPEKTLAAIKEMGYDYVETAGYYGKTAKEFKELLDKYELKAISAHQGYEPFIENEQGMIEDMKTLGVEYCVVPWMPIDKLSDKESFAKIVEDITKVAKVLKANGIKMGYHNHDFEFNKVDGKFIIDLLYESVSEDLLKTEFDTCWVKYSGNDPIEYMRKYAGRSTILHLKDFVCKKFAGGPAYALIDDNGNDTDAGESTDNGFEFRPVGQGLQDFESIIKVAEEVGIEYLIVEQDAWPTAIALESAKQGREYLKTLGQ